MLLQYACKYEGCIREHFFISIFECLDLQGKAIFDIQLGTRSLFFYLVRVLISDVWLQYDLWSDSQRRRFLELLFRHSRKNQLVYVFDWFDHNVPRKRQDFTRVLPRHLSLRIFSLLDPRSLCRAAQVSWHWKFLSEQAKPLHFDYVKQESYFSTICICRMRCGEASA